MRASPGWMKERQAIGQGQSREGIPADSGARIPARRDRTSERLIS
jgi:hypothetical protein